VRILIVHDGGGRRGGARHRVVGDDDDAAAAPPALLARVGADESPTAALREVRRTSADAARFVDSCRDVRQNFICGARGTLDPSCLWQSCLAVAGEGSARTRGIDDVVTVPSSSTLRVEDSARLRALLICELVNQASGSEWS
jgi:hypothetical protein